ncbi:L-ascorbate oxidase homolog [Capsella rubella]|uniref:L-ascorbate oxidase homolog n=1 Tax=Capsella rubella TaxID=81985 RepID=UPI000CD50FDD|nr:L-ascorbate oxidase homolog [Capsella rubella]
MGWWLHGGVWMMMTTTIIYFVNAGDTLYYNWRVTYGDITTRPSLVRRGILINGEFPGPEIRSLTNDSLVIHVHNDLDEPFLLSWNGVHMRKNSYQDGVFGTTCPIPPGKNYTYNFQVKDQIGSYYYFPSLDVQKAAGGYGSLRIYSLPHIPLPFPEPARDITLLIGNWYRRDHKTLKKILDKGRKLKTTPDGVLINGQGLSYVSTLTVEAGKTYRFRISNVGLQTCLNFEILGHQLKLIEVEGTHTVQSVYTSLDIHVGQTYSVLVTMDQPPHNYSIVASTRFIHVEHSMGVNLHYSNSKGLKIIHARRPEVDDVEWSIKQAQSIRTNLTAFGPSTDPQGDNHYGKMKISRTLILESSAALVKRRQRYAINGVSFVPADTPLKLADYFKIKDVFKVGSIPDKPRRGGEMRLDTSVMGADHNAFIEIIFQNREKIVQSYHLDGYNFWVVG